MKPHVLFFCPSFNSGGVEKVFINLANYFCNETYPTSFLVCRQIGGLDSQLSSRVKVISLGKRLNQSLWPAFSFFRSYPVDVVICGPQFINILSVLIFKVFLKKPTRLILTHHSFYDSDVKKMKALHFFYRRLIKAFYPLADIVIAVSSAVKDHLVNEVGLRERNLEVVYNPVIPEDFIVRREEEVNHKWLGPRKNYKVLTCVGRLSQVKNQAALIKLMPDLVKRSNVKLILVGDGEERQSLEVLVRELNMSNHIDLIGSVANPIKYIYASNLLVLPSISETFSLVAVEAIALGVPVVSTPTLGVKEILGDCEGCFFESLEEKEKFILLIDKILNSETLLVDSFYADRFKVRTIGVLYEELVLKLR